MISHIKKTATQRKSSALRRGLGIVALIGLIALPQVASAQSRSPRDGDRVERQASHFDPADAQADRIRAGSQATRPSSSDRRHGSPHDRAMQAERQGQRADKDHRNEAALTRDQAQRVRTRRATRQNDGPRSHRDRQRPDSR